MPAMVFDDANSIGDTGVDPWLASVNNHWTGYMNL